MQYLAWRVLTGMNNRIEMSFMMVGHTKFAPDWCFGLLKQRFRRTKVGCLADIAKVVNDSAVVNYTQLVGTENGTTIVPQYNWSDYFAPFFKRNAFQGIKSLHHLVFEAGTPGVVKVRDQTDSTEKSISVLSTEHKQWAPLPTELPPIITPPGLSKERQQYLFDKIREYCPLECQDIVCPNPNSSINQRPPLPTSTLPPQQTPSPSPSPKRQCQRDK